MVRRWYSFFMNGTCTLSFINSIDFRQFLFCYPWSRIVFASKPIQLNLDGISKHVLQSTQPYSGVLRFALVPPPTLNKESGANSTKTTTNVIHQPPYPSITSLNNSTTVDNLIQHSHVYPVGGKVSWGFKSISLHRSLKESSPLASSGFSLKKKKDYRQDETDISYSNGDERGLFGWKNNNNNEKDTDAKRTIGSITFEYNVRSMRKDRDKNDFLDTSISTAANSAVTATTATMPMNGFQRRRVVKDELLMMALPHHAQVLPTNMIVKEFDTEYYCIKGLLTPVVGNSWYVLHLLFSYSCSFHADNLTLFMYVISIQDIR